MSKVFKESINNFLTPIAALLDDDKVSEIMINGPKSIFIERGGKIEPTDAKFSDELSLQAAIRNIAQSVGRMINEENPRLDARLPDGSRIHAVIPPMARSGTTVSIRKFFKSSMTMKTLLQYGSVSTDAAKFLDICVFLQKNIIVSGGTGSGKTSLLNVMGSRIPHNQRIIVIEDSSELQITAPHAVFFETRPETEGQRAVTIRDLLHSSLRLRPDRIIVGEVRGSEAMELISAMNTGHGGSMGTVHANSPKDCLVRLEMLSMQEKTNIPVEAIRKQLASAVDIIVQIKRMPDGSRKLSHISEVLDLDSQGNYVTQDIYQFVQHSVGENGQIIGAMEATGNIPTFMHEIEVNDIPFSPEKFRRFKAA